MYTLHKMPAISVASSSLLQTLLVDLRCDTDSVPKGALGGVTDTAGKAVGGVTDTAGNAGKTCFNPACIFPR